MTVNRLIIHYHLNFHHFHPVYSVFAGFFSLFSLEIVILSSFAYVLQFLYSIFDVFDQDLDISYLNVVKRGNSSGNVCHCFLKCREVFGRITSIQLTSPIFSSCINDLVSSGRDWGNEI